MGELKHKVIVGTLWNLLERFSGQVVSFGVAMILSRLLTPTDYGAVAILVIFTTIASVFVDSGFGSALVQKKSVSEVDFNSVFYFSICVAVLAYAALYCSSPFIAEFCGIPLLNPLLRVSAITLLFNAINSVQNAELRREMKFRLSFRITLVATLVGGVAGVFFACNGFGPWALVFSMLSSGIVGVIARWCLIGWRPRLMFSWSSLRSMFGYGSRLMFSELLNAGFNNLYGLLIGRIYSSAELAFVQKGNHVPSLLMNNVNGTIGTVMFPALAKMQDDLLRLRESMRRMMRLSLYIVFPIMAMLAVCSKPLILLLFGDQWMPSVLYMQIACFACALYPFHTVNLQGIQALGRSDIFLKLEIIKKTLALAAIVLFLPKGIVMYLLVTAFVLGPISVVINIYPNRKLLHYGIGAQLRDVIPIIGLTIAMTLPSYLLGMLFSADSVSQCVFAICIQCGVGLLIYLLLSAMFRPKPVCDAVNVLVAFMGGRAPMMRAFLEHRFCVAR